MSSTTVCVSAEECSSGLQSTVTPKNKQTNTKQTKRRPAELISQTASNQSFFLLLLLSISSALNYTPILINVTLKSSLCFTCVSPCTHVRNVTVCMVLLRYSSKYPVGSWPLAAKCLGFVFLWSVTTRRGLLRPVQFATASSFDQNDSLSTKRTGSKRLSILTRSKYVCMCIYKLYIWIRSFFGALVCLQWHLFVTLSFQHQLWAGFNGSQPAQPAQP